MPIVTARPQPTLIDRYCPFTRPLRTTCATTPTPSTIKTKVPRNSAATSRAVPRSMRCPPVDIEDYIKKAFGFWTRGGNGTRGAEDGLSAGSEVPAHFDRHSDRSSAHRLRDGGFGERRHDGVPARVRVQVVLAQLRTQHSL